MQEFFKTTAEIGDQLKNWRKIVKKIAKAAKEILGECKVIVFGSVIEERYVGGSDIDVLIITKKKMSPKERAKMIAKIEDKAELPMYHPVEIHLVNEEEAKWYLRHMKRFIIIESK